ncbi:EF-hand domain-containing protein [Pseudodonghicola flavimaris]|uniref:EF-hand domain-containing protein n=1 Tax=Pseudodonghicola flavimaris TaxID=3050036 RepID=A0ABT7EVS8_9RHOB|nr:hypothetical protein [Pseudodonghicola flavimaris]MDK3016453.1 hypothetical protein [Pseudodonghicola flavimaris]
MRMTMPLRAAALVCLLALPGMAAAAGPADTNGDGVLDLAEVQVVAPQITAEVFLELDANADGTLDAEEVAAARRAGLFTPAGG